MEATQAITHIDLTEELKNFQLLDKRRDQFCQFLIEQFEQRQNQLKYLQRDLDNERRSRQFWQDACTKHELELRDVNRKLNQKPFVLALIDGDGMLFAEELLRSGADGGAEAASRLRDSIHRHILSLDETREFEIMVNVFVNLAGLAKTLAATGILSSPGEIRVFVNAFTANQSLFNIIDVGDGKERADHKIKEMFRLFIDNTQCKHILFGACHDAGYLTFIDQYKLTHSASKIILLEGFSEQHILERFKALKYSMVSFSSVFRSTPLSFHAAITSSPKQNVKPPSPPKEVTLPVRPVASVAPAVQELEPTGDSPSTTAAKENSWATVGSSKNSGKVISIASAPKAKAEKKAYYNKNSQRIDQPLPKPERLAIAKLDSKIKNNGKVCNELHFNGKCSNGDYCDYNHEALTAAEILALRVKARGRYCSKGMDCSNVDCFFGHNCPNENCRYDNCYFYDSHGMDKTPVLSTDRQGNHQILKQL